METNKEKIEKLLDYTWSLEEKMREELLENFMKLSSHKSEIDKIINDLLDIKISLDIQNTKCVDDSIEKKYKGKWKYHECPSCSVLWPHITVPDICSCGNNMKKNHYKKTLKLLEFKSYGDISK